MKKAERFIRELLNHPAVQDLENHDDLGIKVSIHTYDVLKSCHLEILKNYKTYEKAREKINFFAIIIGVIIHDLSKGTLRKLDTPVSHSYIMMKNPEQVLKESDKIIKETEIKTCLNLRDGVLKNILHIVVSHHGRWGKIQPGTKEAHIVHRGDEYSAKYHRITPIGSNKILDLMLKGLTMDEIGEELSCTQGIIKDRLKKSKSQLKIETNKQLLNYYKKNKKVPLGDAFFEKRLLETEELIRLVEKEGLLKLISNDKLIEYIDDREIFQ